MRLGETVEQVIKFRIIQVIKGIELLINLFNIFKIKG